MRLSREQLKDWWTGVNPAVFNCRVGPAIGRSASGNLYPLKNGKGFLWLIWDGQPGNMGFNDADKLRLGGTTARHFERACLLVLHELMTYRKGRKK